MAISAKYRKTLIDRQFIFDETSETAEDIISAQLPIAKNRQWKKITQNLGSKPFEVVQTGRGVVLTISYLLRMRFADMRKDSHGNTKPYYTPIYNKIVWGFVYGYLYKRLVYGISKGMNEAITQRLIKSGYKIN